MKIYKMCKIYLYKQKVRLLFYMFVCLLNAIITICIPYLTGSFIDFLIKIPNEKQLISYCTLFFVVEIISILLSLLSNMMKSILNTKISYLFEISILNKIHHCSYEFMKINDPTYLSQRVHTDCSMIVDFCISVIQELFINGVSLVLPLVLLYFISTRILIILIICSIVYISVYSLMRTIIYDTKYKVIELNNIFYSKYISLFVNAKAIILNGMTKKVIDRLDSYFHLYYKQYFKYVNLNAVFGTLDKIIMTVAKCLLFFVGGTQVLNGDLSLGALTVAVSYFSFMINGMSYFFYLGKKIQEINVSYQRIKEILDFKETSNGDLELESINSITIKNLSLKVHNEEIISKLNFSAVKGHLYIIKGENGSGKTTFIDTLLGIYGENFDGQIAFNDINFENLNMKKVRSDLVSINDQKATLLEEDLELVNLSDFRSNPVYNELIEHIILRKKDSVLSGGERKKISIIKTLVKPNTCVYIFDEPESALDIKSLKVFKKIVSELKHEKIVIIISHSNFFNDIADQILDLNLCN